jgi:hypothetical protein
MVATFSQVLVIHAPGRKRANLEVLLGAIFPNGSIQVVDNPVEGLEKLLCDWPALVLISNRLAREEMACYLEEIHRRNPQARVLLMLPHPQENNPYAEIQVDGILYDGFSIRFLLEMLGQLS